MSVGDVTSAGFALDDATSRALFDAAPVPILLEDFSGIAHLFRELRARGVTDLRSHFAAFPDDVVACARCARVLAFTPCSVAFLGATSPDDVPRDLASYFDARAYEAFGDKLGLLWEGCTSFSCEAPIVDVQGRERLLALSLSVCPGHEATLARVIVSFADVTPRWRAEQELRASEARYRELVDLLPEAIFETDRAGRLTFANRALFRLFGYTPAEMPALALEDVIVAPANPLSPVTAAPGGANLSASVEYVGRRRDGTTLPVLVRIDPIAGNGRTRGLRGVIVDLTERKRAEEALSSSDERYRAVVEDLTELVSRLRQDGTILFVNEAYCRFFGRTAAELVGGTWHPRAVEADIADIESRLQRLSAAEPVVVIENRVYSGSGEVRWLQFVNRGFFDAGGRLLEIQSVGRDVTARREAESAQHELSARLTEGVESERRRLARLLHDEMGPNLTALGFTLATLDSVLAPTVPEATLAPLADARRLLEATARQARTLVSDLRPVLLEELGLAAALRSLAGRFADRTGLAVIDRILDVPPPRAGLPAETHLFRIAQEALANVVRHAEARSVTVRLDADAGRLHLSVTDDGRGFEVGASGSGAPGVGLLHLRERALAAGGRLEVRSSPGAGTVVAVEVPP